MNNLNDYNISQCQEYCRQLPFYHAIENDFDELYWDKMWHAPQEKITPREKYGEKRLFPENTIFSMVTFFYLRKLLEQNPSQLYDLGCGWNIFKRYIPNIIGISPTHNQDGYGDIHDIVDDEFVLGHQNYFDSVFSICALHFRSLSELEKITNDFVSMIKPGGRGLLTMNLARFVEETPAQFLFDTFGTDEPKKKDYELYIRNTLSNVDVNFLVVDIDLTVMDESMNGNIRLVIEKQDNKNDNN